MNKKYSKVLKKKKYPQSNYTRTSFVLIQRTVFIRKGSGVGDLSPNLLLIYVAVRYSYIAAELAVIAESLMTPITELTHSFQASSKVSLTGSIPKRSLIESMSTSTTAYANKKCT